MKPAIIVHGGAWNLPDGMMERSKKGVQAAALAGHRVLKEGGSSVDAVCAAIRVLEDDEVFDAGHGSVLTEDGNIEMDAFIMDGSSFKTGAVSCVQCIANPILVARDVMDKTDHCFLTGKGAEKFAKKMGHTIFDEPSSMCAKNQLLCYNIPDGMKYDQSVNCFFNTIQESKDIAGLGQPEVSASENLNRGDCHDTVGAVAIDANGHIACGTSTGGIPMKMSGRVGDTPLIGCGGYANEMGGASSTGHGESIIKTMLCREVIYLLESGEDVQSAVEKGVNTTLRKTGGRCGVISIDRAGNVAFSFTTRRMPWAYVKEELLHYGIDPGEHNTMQPSR